MLIAGNWKMYTDMSAAVRLAQGVVESAGASRDGVQVAVCPPFVSLAAVREVLQGSSVRLGAQNMYHEDEGAFTGEVSAPMLRSVGCDYVILGHSERRQYFGETDASINKKVGQALAHGLIPIVCVGETLAQRREGRERDVVGDQVAGCLDGITPEDPARLVIAYEPVWAIGTGETATPEQAQEMHAFLRGRVNDRYGEAFGRAVLLLYGGSVKPGNAEALFALPDVDGGLIGGASLKAQDFAAIAAAARPA